MTAKAPIEDQLRTYFTYLDDAPEQTEHETPADEVLEFTRFEAIEPDDGTSFHDLQQLQADKEVAVLQKNQTSSPRGRWYAVAAATLLIVGAGTVAVWAVASDDERDAATGADTSGVALARDVVAAFDRHDADFIESVSTIGMTMSEGVDARADIVVADRVAWDAASGFRFEVDECVEGRDDVADASFVVCDVWMSNAWSEALGAEPVTTTYRLELEDGRVVGIAFAVAITNDWADVWATFESFVEGLSAEDHAAMFIDDDDGYDDERATALFARYTDLFVEEMAQS